MQHQLEAFALDLGDDQSRYLCYNENLSVCYLTISNKDQHQILMSSSQNSSS